MKSIYLGMLVGAAAILVGAARSGTPKAVDITRTHGFKDARMCTLQPAGEQLFEGMGALKFKKSLRLTRKIGGIDLAIGGRRSSVPDPSGGSDVAGSTIATPVRPVRWHGMPVRSFATGYSQEAESDLQYWNEIRVDASAAQARALLRRLGVNYPVSGSYIIRSNDPCDRALSVEGKAGVTTIQCAGGC